MAGIILKKESKLFLLNLQGRSGIDQEIESKNIIFEKNINSSYIANCEWIKEKKKEKTEKWKQRTNPKTESTTRKQEYCTVKWERVPLNNL